MDEDFKSFIVAEIRELRQDVKVLLANHNKRIGLSIASSFIFSVIFGLIIAYIEKH